MKNLREDSLQGHYVWGKIHPKDTINKMSQVYQNIWVRIPCMHRQCISNLVILYNQLYGSYCIHLNCIHGQYCLFIFGLYVVSYLHKVVAQKASPKLLLPNWRHLPLHCRKAPAFALDYINWLHNCYKTPSFTT